MLKSLIYPNIFHMALHMSRLIDIAPHQKLVESLQWTQKEISKAMTILELLINDRPKPEEKEEQK